MKKEERAQPRRSDRPAARRKADPGNGTRSRRNLGMLFLACICLLTFIVYAQALTHDFTNWDDFDYVTGNPQIRSLSFSSVTDFFSRPQVTNYHPLTMLSLAFNYFLTGNKPWSYLLVNLLLHLVNTVLVYLLSRKILEGDLPLVLFITAVFALHPMHVESVAWVSGRKDVLYALFFFASMIAWIKYIARRKWPAYLLSFILAACAMLSKPSAVVLPVVLFLLDYIRNRNFTARLVLEKIPFLAVAAVAGATTLVIQSRETVDLMHYTTFQRVLFGSCGLTRYMVMFFWPAGQSAFHPFPVQDASLALPWLYYVAPAAVILVTLAAFYSARNTKVILFGYLFFLVTSILTLQFMQVGITVISERYTYVPYTGLLLALAWLLRSLRERVKFPPAFLYLMLVAWIAALSVLSDVRVRVWENSGTLWSDVIRKYPNCYPAYKIRGHYFMTIGKPALALPDFTIADSIRPGDPMVLTWRGRVNIELGNPAAALIDLTRAISINPTDTTLYRERAKALTMMGRVKEADDDLSTARSLSSPGH